ncbi:hypothetical protein BDV06DRAFT_220076 [Aspergillus oleicola]
MPVGFLSLSNELLLLLILVSCQKAVLCVAALTARATLPTHVLAKYHYGLTSEFQTRAFHHLLTTGAVLRKLRSPGPSPAPGFFYPEEENSILLRVVKNGYEEATVFIIADGADSNKPLGEALFLAIPHPRLFFLLPSPSKSRPNHSARQLRSLPTRPQLTQCHTLRILLDHPRAKELVVDPIPVETNRRQNLIPFFQQALESGEAAVCLLDRGLLDPPKELNRLTAGKYLSLVMEQGSTSFMQLLVDIDFDLRAGNNAGWLVYKAAKFKKDPEGMLDSLLQNGFDINELIDDSHERTALVCAVEVGNENAMRRLLKRGTVSDSRPSLEDAEAALIIAAREGNLVAVELVLEAFDERRMELSEVEKDAEPYRGYVLGIGGVWGTT